MSECHSSARCDKQQRVKVAGVESDDTVHNVKGVKGYDILFGFVKQGEQRVPLRKLAKSEVWEEYTGSGL